MPSLKQAIWTLIKFFGEEAVLQYVSSQLPFTLELIKKA
jgi:hypothetical protein